MIKTFKTDMRNKAIIFCLALMGVVSCSKHDVEDAAPLSPIVFGQPHVENSTKAYNPAYSTGSLEEMTVYGTGTQEQLGQPVTRNIFYGVTVSKGARGWEYDHQYEQYWHEGNQYEFVAVAGTDKEQVMTDSNGMPAKISYSVAGQQDLLMDKYAYGIHGDRFQEQGSKNTTVNFVLSHLLSKVKFTFRNGHPLNSGLELVIKDVKIKNAHSTATYALNPQATETPWGNWEQVSGQQELNFGNVTFSPDKNAPGDYLTTSHTGISTNHQMLMIPGEYTEAEVTFTVELYMNPVMIMGENAQRALLETRQYTRTLPSFTLQQGKCYNIHTSVEMDLNRITFDIHQTTGWEN